ncbi:MAG: hypothetical protein V3S48_07135 [Candidatus Neomarinimicrobiota bacterium]
MKLINILMVSLFALGMVIAQEGDPMAGGDPVNCEDWVNSPGAYDVTGDGKIDLEDCEVVHGLQGDHMTGGEPPNCEEWLNSPEAHDMNGDGVVDMADCEAMKGPPPFGEMDANGDGVIDREEARVFFGDDPNFDADFDRVDSDGDGGINWTEYDNEVNKEMAGGGEPMGLYCPGCDIHFATQEEMDGHMQEMHSDMGGPFNCEEWLNSPEAHDMNGDGVVDMADCEAMKGPPPFGEMDANGDGVIDREESRVFFGEDPNFDAEFDRVDSNGDGGVNWTEYDNEMQRHKAGGGEPMDFFCPGCDIHFGSQEEMDGHMQEMHSDMGGPAPAGDMDTGGTMAPEEHYEYGVHTVNNCVAQAEGKPSYWVDGDEFAAWDNPQCEEVLTNIGWHPPEGN